MDTAETTRYRNRHRDRAARAAHTTYNAEWRRALADRAFNATDRAALLDAVRDGQTVAAAAASLSVTSQAVHGRARWDPEFRTALNNALNSAAVKLSSRHVAS